MALCDESATTVPERRLVPIERDFAQKLQFWGRKLHCVTWASLLLSLAIVKLSHLGLVAVTW